MRVIWAANHDRNAVAAHALNHPGTVHACQDLQLCDWTKVPAHDLLLASPCCQGHSNAKGNRKNWNSQQSRQTAWCVYEATARKRPTAVVVENVPEFRNWTESDDKGSGGEVYCQWRNLMSRIGKGYHYSETVIDAADLGVPQNRERLFMVFVRADVLTAPIPLALPRVKHVAFRKIMRPDRGILWSRVNTLCDNTIKFVKAAGREYRGTRFLAPYYGATRESGVGRSVDRPLGTLTTKDRYGLVSDCHKWLRMLTIDECRAAMGFPKGYTLDRRKTVAMKQLGNAVVPTAAEWVVRQVVNSIQGEKSSLGTRRVAV